MPDVYCVLPFISMQLRQDGNAYPCCRMSYMHSYGSLAKNSLQEIWSGAEINQVRQDLLNAKPVSFCTDCYNSEKAGGESLRLRANKEFAGIEPGLKYLDIRFSNNCNLKCRSCDAGSSSSWYEEALKIYPPTDIKKHVVLDKNAKDLWPQLEAAAWQLKKIYFAGGEPLISKEHYQLLEMLIAKGHTEILLSYNTNLTHLKFGKWDVRELWQKFRQVQIGASIDGIGEQAEFLRSNCEWNQVRKNLLEVAALPKVTLTLFPTVGVLNCFHLPDLLNEMLNLGILKKPENFEMNILQMPYLLSAKILNSSEKTLLRSHYEKFYESLNVELSLKSHLVKELNAFLQVIEEEDLSKFRQDFRKFSFKMDQLRGEKTHRHARQLFGLLYEEQL